MIFLPSLFLTRIDFHLILHSLTTSNWIVGNFHFFLFYAPNLRIYRSYYTQITLFTYTNRITLSRLSRTFSLRGPQWVNQTRDKRSSNLLFAPSLKSTTNVDLPVSHSNPRKTGRHQASSETRSRVETSLSSIPCLQGVVRQSVRLCRIRRTRYVRYQPVHSVRSMDMSRSCSM